MAVGEELSEARRRLRNRVGRGDADDVETGALAVGDEKGLGLRTLRDQKSRSA